MIESKEEWHRKRLENRNTLTAHDKETSANGRKLTRDHTCAPKGLELEIIRAVCRRKFYRAGDSRSRKRHSLVPCDYRGGARELQMIYIPTRPGLVVA